MHDSDFFIYNVFLLRIHQNLILTLTLQHCNHLALHSPATSSIPQNYNHQLLHNPITINHFTHLQPSIVPRPYNHQPLYNPAAINHPTLQTPSTLQPCNNQPLHNPATINQQTLKVFSILRNMINNLSRLLLYYTFTVNN